MPDNKFVIVKIQSGYKNLTVKMERGTSFDNRGDIFTAEKDGQTIKMHSYQFDFFCAVANNCNENGNDEIILSKKDIDIAIQKYSKGTLSKDLSEFLEGTYKIQNPKVVKEKNKISAYVTNGKPATSSQLSISYKNTDSNERVNKPDSLASDKNPVIIPKVFSNPNIIMQKPFKYTLKKHDTLASIAKQYEVDTYQIIAANPHLKEGVDYKVIYRKGNIANIETYIKEGTSITIPARYSVKEGSIRNFNDLCKITGLSEGYIKDLLTVIEVSPKHPGKPDLTTYDDGYGTPTIGYGHTGKVDGKELSLRKRVTITETKALQLLAEDLIKHEAMVIAYMGKENYEKLPISVRSAVLDIAYNKGIWDGFLNPNHNSCTSKIIKNIQEGDIASVLSNTRRMNTPNRGLRRRNIYRFVSGLSDLTPSKRDEAMKQMNGYYKTVLNSLNGAEYRYLKQAWENAKLGKVTGYKIHTTQKDR